MRIKEAAEKSGVTVRTLQYYDRIGLLRPTKVTEAGYRIYEDEDLERLQQILFLRELEFSLQEIKEIIKNPEYDSKQMLAAQKQLLLKKRRRLDGIIDLIDRTLEGESKMSFKEFDNTEVEEAKKTYAKEVKERWGNTSAYKQSQEKTAKYDKDKSNSVIKEGDDIMAEFGLLRGEAAESEKVQALVRKWQAFITKSYYECTDEILAGLGQMYVADERFKNNIDKHGEGTAQLMSDAIAYATAK